MRSASTLRTLILLLSSCLRTALTAPVNQRVAKWPHPGNRALEAPELFEGDIFLPRNDSDDRTVVIAPSLLWPRGIVPFVVESSLGQHTALLREAMNEIEAKSCLRFVMRTTQRNYITIFRGSGCYSAIGHQTGAQPVSLGHGCIYKGTMVHELLHAVGFYHEHSRSDRDNYIQVFTANAKPESVKQFDKLEPWQNRLISPFDVNSVMLYGSHAFASAPGLVTMLRNDGGKLTEVYDKPGLSDSDVHRINVLYKCRR